MLKVAFEIHFQAKSGFTLAKLINHHHKSFTPEGEFTLKSTYCAVFSAILTMGLEKE